MLNFKCEHHSLTKSVSAEFTGVVRSHPLLYVRDQPARTWDPLVGALSLRASLGAETTYPRCSALFLTLPPEAARAPQAAPAPRATLKRTGGNDWFPQSFPEGVLLQKDRSSSGEQEACAQDPGPQENQDTLMVAHRLFLQRTLTKKRPKNITLAAVYRTLQRRKRSEAGRPIRSLQEQTRQEMAWTSAVAVRMAMPSLIHR
ncbi:uncharacterized protein LOC116568212 [Mustela erminea]|uniref:uncharacterized protein LOC116568212 n=1 Tax=Mustela erminea TaxID=36723 RepID=UPI001386E945|nr:uncharacterized protein LOC116568212 [Mustela erminea]